MSTKETDPPAEGSLVDGRFRILRRLGEGAFGTSYLAEEPSTGRRVVLKLAAETDEDGSLGRRLVAEGKVLSRVAGPRIARLLDFGALKDGRPYLVLEWIEGSTLREILEGGPLSPPKALDVLGALAEALASVHAAGVIHRDLKPTNVVLPAGPGGPRFREATLIDFGAFGELVQKVRWETSTGQTRAGQFFGTPYYMAPEQIAAAPQSPATDVYGLGILLYEMLFGRPPFFGEPLFSFFGKRLHADVPVPLEPQISAGIRSFLENCLRRDPTGRPGSAVEVLKVIEGLRAGWRESEERLESTGASPVPPVTTTAVPAAAKPVAAARDAAASVPEPTARRAAPPGGRIRHPAGWALAAGLLVAVILFFFLGARVRSKQAAPGGAGSGSLAALSGIAAGVLLIGGGVALGLALSRFLRSRGGDVQKEAGLLLLGAKSRDVLTSTLAVQIDELIARCRRVDEKFLGLTIAHMVREYEVAADSGQKQAALMNAAQLLERLMSRLSPWYVRHEKALAFAVSFVGVLTGVVSLVASVLKMAGRP